MEREESHREEFQSLQTEREELRVPERRVFQRLQIEREEFFRKYRLREKCPRE